MGAMVEPSGPNDDPFPAQAAIGVVRPRVRRGGLALLGLLLVLAAVPLYVPFSDVAFLRSSALPTFVLAGLGVACGLIAARHDARIWVRATAGVGVALLGLYLAAFFWLAALPPASSALKLDVAPDFTLLDQNEKPVVLREAYTVGPVLLVFYRGHW